jgi:phosphoribosylanthranilate isomerase
MKPKVKICCIGSLEEARTAMEFGADAVGLVGQMPGGPGVIPDELIREIARNIPPPVSTFLLTSETSAEGILRHHQDTCTGTIQIVDIPEAGTYERMRQSIPAIKLVQVIHVIDESSVDLALEVSGHVDVLLLDSGNPNLRVKELGGTGRTHDWRISRRIRDRAGIPVFLAGGLHTGNVRQAVEEVDPWGIDLCNGVRTSGVLDRKKLDSFFRAMDFQQP